MGIDYSGGMIVGELVSELCIPSTEELDEYEWIEENGLDIMSQFFDCDIEYCCIGFRVNDIHVSEITGAWLDNVKELSEKFQKLLNVPAKLIGTQDIY